MAAPPEVWDIVRRAVDFDPIPGQFLLTGSATPTDAPSHSGAGRIVTIRMRPLSLAERFDIDTPTSLATLLSGERAPLHGSTDLTVADYAREIVGSGLPAVRQLVGRAHRSQLDSYLQRIMQRDFDELGHRLRNEGALRRWLTAYAAATSSTAFYDTIRDSASSGESDKPAKSTTDPTGECSNSCG